MVRYEDLRENATKFLERDEALGGCLRYEKIYP